MLKTALVGLNIPGYRSLALGYLRAHAESHRRLQGRVGFQTLDLDHTLDPWWVAYRLAALTPDAVAFSVTCWNARNVYETCRILARALPDCAIILGGPEVSPIAEEVLAANPGVLAVVRGEGEETFAELLDTLSRKRSLRYVEGVTSRDGDGVSSAPDRSLIAELDSIPSPWLAGLMEPLDGASYIETYRGCPHRCGYCFEGKGYGRVRSFSRERVAAEVEAVLRHEWVRSLSFVDPVFNLTDDRLRWLAELLEPHARAGVRLHTVEVDVERVDAESASLMARAGVTSVETGPQTVGAKALEICCRRFDKARFVAGVEALRDASISVECDLIVGLPGDNIDDIVEGMSFVVDLDPGRMQMSSLHVLPGTDLWERAAELGLAHDPMPPHEVVATRQVDFADLRRAELLGAWVQAEYQARI